MRIVEQEEVFDPSTEAALLHTQAALDAVYPNGVNLPVNLRRVAKHLGVSLWSLPVDRRVEMRGWKKRDGSTRLRIEAPSPSYKIDTDHRYQVARCLGVSLTPVGQRTGQVFPVLTEYGTDDLAMECDHFAQMFALGLLIPRDALFSSRDSSHFRLAQTFAVRVRHIDDRIKLLRHESSGSIAGRSSWRKP